MITILRRTERYNRSRIVLSHRGIEALFERRKVGGGWYPREIVVVPWPWKKVS